MLIAVITIGAFQSTLVLLRFWEQGRNIQAVNLAIALCFGVDLFFLENKSSSKLEIFDVIAFILPNMYLLMNPYASIPVKQLYFQDFGVPQNIEL